jgi:hypothetical protein
MKTKPDTDDKHGIDKSEALQYNTDNKIECYLQCRYCCDEVGYLNSIDDHINIKHYAQVQVGLTTKGVQVWCRRHNCNIAHIEVKT